MAEKKTAKKTAAKKSAKGTADFKGFSAGERAAMKERAAELKAAANKEDGERQLLAKAAEMPPAERAITERLHALVMATVPELMPKTWYGMPAWANKDGKVICFFKAKSKFGERNATFGFGDDANLDTGNMWPTTFGLTKLTAAEETKIRALVKKAVR